MRSLLRLAFKISWPVAALILFYSHGFAFSPISGRVIYGEDDRRDLYEVTDHYWLSASDSVAGLILKKNLIHEGKMTKIIGPTLGADKSLCPSERFIEQTVAADCSGFLIDKNKILTANHCIENTFECSQTKIVFGFQIPHPKIDPTVVPTDDVYSCIRIIQNKHGSQDFALIELDRDVTGHQPLPLMKSIDFKVGDALAVIGHPAGVPLKISVGGIIRDIRPEFFVASIDTYGGSSGSPVFHERTGAVIGIVVRGESDYEENKGCRISKRCPESGCRGEDVSRLIDLKFKEI
jgi:S1-C subfamily serine protease